MQSIFRLPSLPWSPGSALDKKAAFTPIIELPSSTKAKRKRAAHSPGSSPKPVLKKAKPSEGGAVQGLAQQPARVDGAPLPPAASAEWAQRANPAPRVDGYHANPPRPVATGATPTSTSTSAQRNSTDVTLAPQPGQPRVPSTMAHQAAAVRENVKSSAARLPASSLPANHAATATATAPFHQPRPSKQQDMAQTKPAIPLNKDVLRAIIEAEINHAILFKHNELRLIEQEMAKCQTGLEQIRRCQLIPFPGSQDMSLDQINHTGPALVAPNGLAPPADPAPWGVTDGPYSRHYSSWLLPSPRFDPHAPEAVAPMPLNSPRPKDGRITRGSTDVASPLATSHYQTARAARATGARTRASLDTMSPAPPRDPLVIKRQKDGQWVKLYCTQCLPERSDFANVQGFLNHCRISHKLDFKSHEAAAIECGRVVEHNDYFGSATPTSATAGSEKAPLHSQVKTPLRDTGVLQPRPALTLSFPPSPAPMLDRPAVHPLNRTLLSARDRRPPAAQQIIPRAYSASQANTPRTLNNHTPNFRPATDAPFLSSLLGKRGYSGDMDHLVKNAKRRVDLSVYDDESEEPEDAGKKLASPAKANSKSKSKSARQAQHTPRAASTPTAKARAGGAGARRKAPAASLPLARVPPTLAAVASADSPASTTDAEMSPQTADSNPGLVSDRDDEDDEEEEEEEEEVDGEGQQQARDPDEMVVVIEGSDGEGSTRRGVGVICSARG
jgi:ADA HAT complex component 1